MSTAIFTKVTKALFKYFSSLQQEKNKAGESSRKIKIKDFHKT